MTEDEESHPEGWLPTPGIPGLMAEPTGFEPATSDVTGRRSNQLNYDSAQLLTVKNHSERQCEYRRKRQPFATKVVSYHGVAELYLLL
jgi:hypothetical protein